MAGKWYGNSQLFPRLDFYQPRDDMDNVSPIFQLAATSSRRIMIAFSVSEVSLVTSAGDGEVDISARL